MAPCRVTNLCLQNVAGHYSFVSDFVALVERHWDGILAWHHSHVSNGLLEGTNSLIQAAKARARGYRSKDKMITIAYLIAGKLPLPTVTTPTPA
ncbi:MAG: transposase [Pseudonocardiaceae bacterium]